MGLPDRQTVYYEALIKAAAEQLDAETFAYASACEPRSHDFGPDPWEYGYDDADEFRQTITEIGARDVEEKISFWEEAIDTGYVTGGIDPIQRAEMRVGA